MEGGKEEDPYLTSHWGNAPGTTFFLKRQLRGGKSNISLPSLVHTAAAAALPPSNRMQGFSPFFLAEGNSVRKSSVQFRKSLNSHYRYFFSALHALGEASEHERGRKPRES